MVAISSRSVLFFRDYRGITGGHIKVSDYFDHLLASELYDPTVYLTPNSQPNHLWQSGPVVDRYEPENAEILFVAGMDWSALSHWPGIEDRKPVVNLVQHLRHANPDDPRYQFLNRRVIRVCVSKEVGDALMQTGRCNGPVYVVPNGVDIDMSASEAGQRNTSDVFIAGLKQPEIAIRLASVLSQRGLQVTCATRRIDRSAFLSLMAGARIVVVHSVRRELLDGKVLKVSNVTRSDFNLYIKHPAFFTACLPFLSSAFECFASVRNPLAILLSWRDCDLPVSAGRLPAAEQMDQELKSRLDSENEVLARQLILLDFIFDRYDRFLPDRVIRYEDIVSSKGRALSLITGEATALTEDLVSRNYRQLGNDPDARAIAERLMATDNACWNFYDKSEVEELFTGQQR